MVYNALAAISVGYLMGVKPAKMQQALAMFRNAGMRQEIIKRDGYTVIADCYNAGPESMEAALQVLADTPTQGRRIAVLGGYAGAGRLLPGRALSDRPPGRPDGERAVYLRENGLTAISAVRSPAA